MFRKSSLLLFNNFLLNNFLEYIWVFMCLLPFRHFLKRQGLKTGAKNEVAKLSVAKLFWPISKKGQEEIKNNNNIFYFSSSKSG
jgi:hypothetical protein